MAETLLQKAQRLGIKPAGRTSPRIERFRSEAQAAEAEAQRIGSFSGQTMEAIGAAGEISGITPTIRRGVAATAPLFFEPDRASKITEELVGGITGPKKLGEIGQTLKELGIPEPAAELVDIALDLPLISLGISKGVAKQAGKILPEVLGKPLMEFVPKGIKSFLETDLTTRPIEKAGEVLDKLRPSKIIGQSRNYLSRANTADNVETSIGRLSDINEFVNKEGKKIFVSDETPDVLKVQLTKSGFSEQKYNPLKAYDEFYDQELKFKKDVKQDTAISKVGERIGDSFDGVIRQRSETGKRMAEEIKKVGNIETDIEKSFTGLEMELINNGLIYDVDSGTLKRTKLSKVTEEDRDLVQEYVEKLNILGTNPSAAELDAFLSRIPKELDVFKRTKNITEVTNGERIVKSHLRELREVFNPKNNKQFANYYGLRKDYAALSDFLDEGSRFLGGKSQAGDYVKDASVAKSAVQSILNQGKKDWLLKLEELTGYPALDESVLALQAMKDAGNFRGRSLLDILTEQQGVPTSARNITQRAIKAGTEFLGEKFIGPAKTQTRRVIFEIMQKRGTLPPNF